FVSTIIPYAGVGNSASIVFPLGQSSLHICCLLANFNALVLDYVARQKIPGTNVNFFMVEQFPILPPHRYTKQDLKFVTQRVIELTYTSFDLQPWAKDMGYTKDPFAFNPERRAQLRAELDAYYAKLYSISRSDLAFILDPALELGEHYPSETFRVL